MEAVKREIPVPKDRPDLARLWEIVDPNGEVIGWKERPKIKPPIQPMKKSTRALLEEILEKLQ